SSIARSLPATASLPAPRSPPSRRTSPSRHRSCAWTHPLPAPHPPLSAPPPTASTPQSSPLLSAFLWTCLFPLFSLESYLLLCGFWGAGHPAAETSAAATAIRESEWPPAGGHTPARNTHSGSRSARHLQLAVHATSAPDTRPFAVPSRLPTTSAASPAFVPGNRPRSSLAGPAQTLQTAVCYP